MPARTGSATLPLHGGRVPQWLADRMAKLGRVIIEALVYHYGRDEVLRRLSHPFWFQSFGAVMGMDWHSSGITTSVLGALKRGLAPIEQELGLYVCGGRGRHSRQTPLELTRVGERTGIDGDALARTSRLVAKVDSAAIQDGYDLYLHGFIVSADGRWCVVQQGMSDQTRTARRYHWLSESVTSFVNEPHQAICSDQTAPTLNLVAAEHDMLRSTSLQLATDSPGRVMDALRNVGVGRKARAVTTELPFDEPPTLVMPNHHALQLRDIDPRHLRSVLLTTYDRAPENFEALLGLEGVGPKTLRALALVSEVIYGTPASTRDPARFAFAHGGKDGTPFPVDRATYDQTIDTLHRAMARAKVDRSDKVDALKRLSRFAKSTEPVM